MTKTIFEEMGGTYRQVGDYLLPNITVPAEEEIEPIGLWGKRHARHLKEHYKVLYMNLLTSGKLHSYLAEVDKQAEDMFLRLVKEYADRQDVTEQLKKDNKIYLIVGGGDGTVSWVINDLVSNSIRISNLIFGILPIGTGNDMCRALGWPVD
jgi:hypothetical protein